MYFELFNFIDHLLLFSVSSFENCYLCPEQDIRGYVLGGCKNITVLNFNHCYWLPQRLIYWTTTKCSNLKGLHVIECRLRSNILVNILAQHQELEELSFSISSFAEVHQEEFSPIKGSLKKVRKLSIYYSRSQGCSVNYLGEHASLLDFCSELESLHLGSAAFGISELYRPIITNPALYEKLHTMTITSNIHAESQMFFYGTLSQLNNHEIYWKTLLMPNINLKKFPQLSAFQHCLTHVSSLKSLDMSGSMATLPVDVLSLTATSLTYLNLKCTLLESNQLKKIVDSCPNLKSLNVCGCPLLLTTVNSFELNDMLTFSAQVKLYRVIEYSELLQTSMYM